MIEANKHRGEVAFDLFAGAAGYETIKPGDVVLRFTNDDLARIESEIEVDGMRAIAQKIQSGGVKAAQSCLAYGLKSSATGKRFITNRNWLDDTPFSIGDATRFIGDALFWNIYGKTPDELMAEMNKAPKQDDDGELDQSGPFVSSGGSSTTEL